MGATNGAETAYPSGTPEFTLVVSGVCSIFSCLSSGLQIVVYPFVIVPERFVLLRSTTSDYPFGIFKIFY
jgi:hypothetical protein